MVVVFLYFLTKVIFFVKLKFESRLLGEMASDAFERFFVACGVPAKMVPKYAAKFVNERIRPNLMKDLGKEDLRELGIAALGDQLSIMRYIKQCDGNPPEFNLEQKMREKVAEFDSEEDEPMVVDSGFSTTNFKAPDRDEIYHVKMPVGSLPKTRKILEKHKVLRDQGIIRRGVTGVRKSGIELGHLPLNTVSARSKIIGRRSAAPKTVEIQDTDISSSTGFGTMRSDSISVKTTVVSDNNPIRPNFNSTLSKRFEILGRANQNIRVPQLGTPKAVRTVSLPSPKRTLVRYDHFLEPVMEVRPGKAMTSVQLPIAQRVQLVGGGGQRQTDLQGRHRPPVITVHGRNIQLGEGPRRGMLGGPAKRASILDRITVKK